MKLTEEQSKRIENNIGIAYFMANKFNRNCHLMFDELLSISFEALTVASINCKNNDIFPQYAFKMVRYAILKEIEQVKMQKNINQTLFLEHLTNPKLFISEIDKEEVSSEVGEKYNSIIEGLRNFQGTQREKAAVINFVKNPNLTQKEIAQIVGVGQKTVSTALIKFKEQIQEAI